MSARRFRPTFWASAAALVGVAVTIALGFWQLDRARQKEEAAARQEQLDRVQPVRIEGADVSVAALESRQVEAFGRFEPEGVVWLDNRVRNGIVGYEVVMPLRVRSTGARVLVDRGWTAGTGDRSRMPEVTTPVEDIRVSGRAVVPGKRIFELGADVVEGRVWQNLTVERYRTRIGIAVLPIMIEQANDTADALLREWPAPDRGADVNRSYAVQWFALAALVAVVYLALSFRRDAANA